MLWVTSLSGALFEQSSPCEQLQPCSNCCSQPGGCNSLIHFTAHLWMALLACPPSAYRQPPCATTAWAYRGCSISGRDCHAELAWS